MLFQFKKVLAGPGIAGWKFKKSAIRIDENTLTMKVDDEPVLQVSTKEETLDITWLSKEWETWQDLLEAPEYKEILDKCNTDLRDAAAKQGKGSGKGKSRIE